MAAAAASSLCCSIEMEPKTLSEGQLNQARETAGGIAKKFQPQEAEFIFTQGLKSIHSIKETGFDEMFQNRRIEQGIATSTAMNDRTRIIEKPCQCALADPQQEPSSTQGQAITNEPHTAPF